MTLGVAMWSLRTSRRVLVGLLLLVGGTVACSSSGGESADDEDDRGSEPMDASAGPVPGEVVARPTVTGPVTGGTYGKPFNPMPSQVAEQYGYVEQEFVVAGQASSYQPQGELGEDGRWTVTPAGTAPYRTRILVRYPDDAESFDGTVFVEWLNVTAGVDSDPEFGTAHPDLLRQGSAYVGVSAQRAGIEGGGALPVEIPGVETRALKAWDPQRYGGLSHPGDQYAYDIFSQVAQVIRRPGEVGLDVLDGRRARHVIAMGQSQSGARMLSYVDAVHPLAGIYDGFLVHSRGAGGAPLDASPSALGTGVPTRVRDDLDEPVLQFFTETELFGVFNFFPARQDDHDTLRTWEVAGAAHADRAILDYGAASIREWDPGLNVDIGTQCASVNQGPQGQVLRAAIAALRRWVTDGEPPPHAPPIEVEGSAIARDANGIARGGIRTPAVDAPIATLTGEAQPGGPVLCLLFGGTTPFYPATVDSLYVSHDDYVATVTESAEAAVDAGFLLPDDAEAMIAAAEEAAVP